MSSVRPLPVLAAAVAGLLACFLLTEYDVCWHLRAGEWILAHGEVPRADAFSYTVTGKPWIDFEWLSQAVFYVLTAVGGLDALIAFKMLVTVAAFLCIAASCRRLGAPASLAAGVMVLAALGAHERFFSRPDMFTHLGVAWTVYAYLQLGRGRKGPALTLPVVQALWANLHGAFVMGLLIGLAFAAGTWLNGLLASPDRADGEPPPPRGTLGWTLAVTLLCAAACLLNPYGASLALYPLTEVPLHPGGSVRSVFLDTIAEWQSPFAQVEVGHPGIMAFYGWTVVWGILFLLRAGRVDFRGACLALGTFALAASARRHIAIDMIATAPFLARELAGASREVRRRAVVGGLAAAALYAVWMLWMARGQPHPAIVLATLLVPAVALAGPLLRWIRSVLEAVWPSFRGVAFALVLVFELGWVWMLVSDRFNRAYGNGRTFGFGATEANYPEAAVRYMEEQRIYGRIFNNLAAGGFLAWRAPQYPVFIDGRNILYGEDFYRHYIASLTSPAAWRSLVDTWGISVALVSRGEALGDFLERMERDPEWRLVYADRLASLFVRRTPAHAALLARLPPGVVSRPPAPVGPPRRALARATGALQRVLGPAHGPAVSEEAVRAAVLQSQGDLQGAARCYAAALEADPEDILAGAGLAAIYEETGALPMAEALLRNLLLRHTEPALHGMLGTVLLKEGRRDEAIREYALLPADDSMPFNNLGVDLLREAQESSGEAAHRRFQEASDVLTRALELKGDDPSILCNLAAAQEGLGRPDEVLRLLRKASELDPRGPGAARLAALYAELLKADPGNAALAGDLSALYRRMGETAAAEAWARRASAAKP